MKKSLFLTSMLLLVGSLFAFSNTAIKSTIEVINKGVSSNTTTDLLNRVDQDILSQPKACVIMMVGTNDMLNSKKLSSYADYEKKYRELVKRITDAGHKLILVTLPPFYEPYVLERHPASAFAPDGPQKRLEMANEIIKKIAIDNTCEVVDLNKILTNQGAATEAKSSLFRNQQNSNVKDGIHLTPAGYKVMAQAIYNVLKSTTVKGPVICFGDSLTFGAYMKGQGTATGDTYPAILQQLLNH